MEVSIMCSASMRPSANVGDQRAAGVDIDLTRNRTTAAPLHPMVRRR
ncbi:hypothetical protein RE6C_04091 [Rhodopirellula europaea 6C]|uniref:Uncharacterized protein n=1 Tax=Rhodopirellula europaea 6C TaxID=1263867 RepID=M2B064_9BACT|nr:hypothetical protein RE6C_04091 [Rhodopirellula europaea 6C]